MADVNWNLALFDPFKAQKEGSDYATQTFDQGALLKAGNQYAGGDYAGAANTVASRGDFATAGKLQDLGTARTAGAQYAAGDYAGAGKTFATAGNIDEAGKLQDRQAKQFILQHNTMKQVVPYLQDAITQGLNPAEAFRLIIPKLKAVGTTDDAITQAQQGLASNPAQTLAAFNAMGNIDPEFKEAGGVLYVFDKNNPTKPIAKLGDESTFGNTAEGKALNIVAKGPSAPNFGLAKAFLERQQPSQIVDGHIIQGPSFRVPDSILGGPTNQPGSPPPAGGSPPPSTTGTGTQIGNKTIYDLPTSNKALPPTVEKEEHDDVQAIFAAGNVAKDMKPFRELLTSGKLTLGPISNAISAGQNWAGYSTEGSRGYDTMMNALLQMRDATLLLQKGTQTDGDARRAWDAILSTPNDVNLVNDRLELISELNDRAVQEHHLQIDLRRRNNNLEPYDWRGFQIPESPYAQTPPPDVTGRTVPRPPPVTSAPLRAPRAQAKPKYKIERVED